MDSTQTALPLTVRAHASALPVWVGRCIAATEIGLASGIPTQVIVAVTVFFGAQMPIFDGDSGRVSLQFIAVVTLLDTALIAILIRLFLERSGETSRSVFLGERPIGREILRGVVYLPVVFVAITALILGLRAVAPWLHTVKESPILGYLGSPVEVAIFAVVVVLGGGVREELQRAFILHRFGQHFGGLRIGRLRLPIDGRVLGLLLYGPLFGLLHIDQGLDVVVAVGMLGLFWGVLYIKRRSAVTGMVNHAGFNAAQVLQAALARSFGM